MFDRCLISAPNHGRGDEELAAKLASLRFLLPRHWCVDSLKDSGESPHATRLAYECSVIDGLVLGIRLLGVRYPVA